jgi:hypothetical protein
VHGMLVGALPYSGCQRGDGLDMEERKKYWFPAKRYGWGWGPPTSWQGWAVLAVYVAFVVFISMYFSPDRHPLIYPIGIAFATCVLIGVCLKKGEPPAWRWGRKKEQDRNSA